jgi:hypothetical protein
MKYVLLTLLAGICVSLYFYEQRKFDEQSVILEIERASAFTCGFCSEDIFVNNIKVGAIRNGATERLRLKPLPDEKFVIFTRWSDEFESNTVTVQAAKGSTIHARCIYDLPWFGKASLLLKDVTVEKPDREVAEERPPLERAEMVPKPGTSKGFPWDAIGAIAGVVCAIFTVLAFWKD